MNRQDLKFEIVVLVLLTISTALYWRQFGAWAILVSIVVPAIAIVLGIYISKWTEK